MMTEDIIRSIAEAKDLFDLVYPQMRVSDDDERRSFRWFVMGYQGSKERIKELEAHLRETHIRIAKLGEIQEDMRDIMRRKDDRIAELEAELESAENAADFYSTYHGDEA